MSMSTVRSRATGSALIEVLIAILVTAFALLGLANLQGRAMVGEVEAYGRSQALVLAEDMVNRINSNRKNAATYVLAGFIGGAADCPNPSGTSVADRDLCQWKAALDGTTEISAAAKNLGGATTAHGCIVSTGPNSYLVTVVWQGSRKTSDAINACAASEYPNDGTRRALSLPLTIATLATP
jgi:type IV pilus assembly protein PilV